MTPEVRGEHVNLFNPPGTDHTLEWVHLSTALPDPFDDCGGDRHGSYNDGCSSPTEISGSVRNKDVCVSVCVCKARLNVSVVRSLT